MMLRIEPVNKKSKDFPLIEDLYLSAFPDSERAPMPVLLRRAEKEFVDFNAFYDDGIFVGFTYIITNGGLTFLMFLAVDSNIRSKGYGSRILSYIKEKYPNNRIALSIEVEDEKADNNEQRKKRRDFYIKNGYSSAGFLFKEFGVIYEALSCNGTFTLEEYQALFKKFVGPLFSLLNMSNGPRKI